MIGYCCHENTPVSRQSILSLARRGLKTVAKATGKGRNNASDKMGAALRVRRMRRIASLKDSSVAMLRPAPFAYRCTSFDSNETGVFS